MVWGMRTRVGLGAVAALLAGLAALVGGCRDGGGEKAYDVRGVVREIRAADREVVVRHERIPGYMEAMTMPFPVESLDVLKGVKAGDLVAFRLRVTETNSRSDHFVVLSNAPATATPAVVLNDTNAVSLFVDVPVLKPGDPLPDYVFTNQLGRVFRLSEFRGKVLVFDFIFTRCPLPDFCPRLSANFQETQRLLRSNPAIPPNWHLLSLSFDPLADTPEVLTQYARRYGADPATWTFGTGAYEQLQPLGAHFGLYFAKNVTPDYQNHNLRTVVVGPDGRVAEVYPGYNWTPRIMAERVADLLGKKP